ncbi:MAG: quinone-dependent dihydroorotate dehydrogenase [Gammaproteobacteria bacterium]
MNLYPLFRPALFALDPETAHEATLKLLQTVYQTGLSRLVFPRPPSVPVTVMGLEFENPVGLAAGMDKNGDCIDALGALGFGFLEIGTVTPRPQPGNPKPRLYRLPEYRAIINRMGFNNKGVEHLLNNARHRRYRGVLGINIGKNFDTPIERAAQDYLIGLRNVYAVADYVAVNISSPNTENLRRLQQGAELENLIAALKMEQQQLQQRCGKYTPLALKIAPDLDEQEVVDIARLLLEFEIDGVIATNTTIAREGLDRHPSASEIGGLSGAPLKNKATAVVKILASELNGKIPIIASGGVLDPEDALEKIKAGASLVQIYSGLIYKGPQLVLDIIDKLLK